MLIFLFLQADFRFFRFSPIRFWFCLHCLFIFTGLFNIFIDYLFCRFWRLIYKMSPNDSHEFSLKLELIGTHWVLLKLEQWLLFLILICIDIIFISIYSVHLLLSVVADFLVVDVVVLYQM